MHLGSDYMKQKYIMYSELGRMYFLSVIRYWPSSTRLCQDKLILSVAETSSTTPDFLPDNKITGCPGGDVRSGITVFRNRNNLIEGCQSRILPFSIRNQLGDTQIPKISQKCREKLRFLNYFWIPKIWGSFWEFDTNIYVGGALK